jgi:hypothetical protein
MKNIRHINIRNTAIAIVAVAGVAVAITACSRNSSTDSASKALETTIETVANQSESEAKIQSPAAVSSVSGKVGSPAASSSAPSTATPLTDSPSTDTPASAEVDPILESAGTETDPSIETEETAAEPSTESPATTPSTTTPDTTTPATASPSIPALALSPTIRFVTFALDGTNIDTSILVEEAGLGRNDIVSVEFTYTKFGTERTVTATKASSTTTSSLWLVESLMLPVGSTVKIHAVDARGNSDDITKTVVLSTAMG